MQLPHAAEALKFDASNDNYRKLPSHLTQRLSIDFLTYVHKEKRQVYT